MFMWEWFFVLAPTQMDYPEFVMVEAICLDGSRRMRTIEHLKVSSMKVAQCQASPE